MQALAGAGIRLRFATVDAGDPHPNTYRLTLRNAREEHRLVAISTGGGDAPGLNAVIRAVFKTAENVHGWEVYGVRDGFEGFLVPDGKGIARLERADIAGILPEGGTILGASNRLNLFEVRRGRRVVDESRRLERIKSQGEGPEKC
jgi:6-phosphofructokinase